MKIISGVMIDFESRVSQLRSQTTKESESKETTNNSSDGDELIIKKIESEGLKFKDTIELISQIKDQDIKLEQIKKLLEALYTFDKDTSRFPELQQENTPNDLEIMTIIKSAIELIDKPTKVIDELAKRITAKQLAIDYKRIGCIIFTTFKELDCISYINMLETDMPTLIIEELGKLYPNTKLEPELIKEQILTELAEDIANACNESETHEIEIPKSRALKNLTPEERDKFIEKINSKLDEGIDKDTIKASIITQLDEPVIDKQYYIEKIGDAITSMNDNDSLATLKFIDKMVEDVYNKPDLLDNIQNMYDAVSIIPNDDMDKAVNAFAKTVNERFSTKEQTGA